MDSWHANHRRTTTTTGCLPAGDEARAAFRAGRSGSSSDSSPATFVVPQLLDTENRTPLSYSDFIEAVDQAQVDEIRIANGDGEITGTFVTGEEFVSNGPVDPVPEHVRLFEDRNVAYEFYNKTTNFFLSLLPLLLPISLLILFFWWMQRRAQGQMSGIMSIGRSRAKTYTTERPGTTFADVAGYEGVKQEITEVVDFLKKPEQFAAIGARIPKGVLLVGPPGTGKTLIARAVAGEAGVPFLSVTGSDFMEMFVGVGASRVRDLFQSARKLGRRSSSSTRSTRSAASEAPVSVVATTNVSRHSTRCSPRWMASRPQRASSSWRQRTAQTYSTQLC